MSLLHALSHWLGWNHGTVYTWRDPDGRYMVGFKCSECGCLSGVHESRLNR